MVETAADITKPWKDLLGKLGDAPKYDSSISWKGTNSATGLGFSLKTKLDVDKKEKTLNGQLTGMEFKAEYKNKAAGLTESLQVKQGGSVTLEGTKDEFNCKFELERPNALTKAVITGNYQPSKGLRGGVSVDAKNDTLPITIGGGYLDPNAVSFGFEVKVNGVATPPKGNQLEQASGAKPPATPERVPSMSATLAYGGLDDTNLYGAVTKAGGSVIGAFGVQHVLVEDVATGALRVTYPFVAQKEESLTAEAGLNYKLDKSTSLNPRFTTKTGWLQFTHEVNERTKVTVASGVAWSDPTNPTVGVTLDLS